MENHLLLTFNSGGTVIFQAARRPLDRRALNYIGGSQDATTGLRSRSGAPAMPAPLSLRIKERYMAKRASGLSQQVAADAVGI